MNRPLARSTALLFAFLCASCPSEPTPPKAKNVLLIVADTLRADRMGCYGYPRATTPFIDSLAKRGTLYEHNHSNGCWTVPSMISMFSGLYVTQEETKLPERFPSLAESLRKGGLETAAFVGNGVLSHESGFDRGFDVFEPHYEETALQIAASFEAWFDAREQKGESKPFFAWVHFIDPHQPYAPSSEFDVFHDRRPDYDELLPRWKELEPKVAIWSDKVKAFTFDEAVAEMERLNNLYDGEVRQVDEGVRRVVERLVKSGADRDTLIVFCADHGEMLFEHPHTPFLVKDRIDKEHGLPGGVKDLFMNGHRPWYYENLWNTPLFFVGPGVPEGKRVTSLVSNLAIYPTLLESLDLPRVPTLQGKSCAFGRELADERVFAYGHQTSALLERDGRKLIVYPRNWFLLPGEGEKPAVLFDLGKDPKETKDVASERATDVEVLRGTLGDWHTAYAREAVLEHSAEALEMLKKMGYVDGGQ